MLVEELESLIANLRALGGDGLEVEAKRATGGLPGSLRETLSAFSNTVGGTILLGVDEKSGFAVTGVEDPAKMASDLASLCATDMDPPLRPVIQQMRLEQRWVVTAEVPELTPSQRPCFVRARGMNRGSYIRVHDGDQQMTTYEVQMVLASRGQPQDDIDPVPGTSIADLEVQASDRLVDRVKERRPFAFQGLDKRHILRRLNVLVDDDQGTERVSLAGWLALAEDPQRRYPQLGLTFVSYPTEYGPDTNSGIRFLDNVALEGSIPVIARDALAVLRRNMRRRSIVSGVGRSDVWEYPESALREAIVNALVHRDFSSPARGSQVQVEMYPNKLVIRNPGGLFGPVTVADLTEDSMSSSRNSFLLRLLEDVAVPGEDRAICENRGSGIRTMVEALRSAGLTPPLFDDKISSFIVTFPNVALLNNETVGWLSQLDEVGLTEAQVVGLAVLRAGERLDNSKYRSATGVDSRVATAELQDLVSRELVVQFGSRRWTEYALAPRVQVAAGESTKRLPPRDRRQMLLDALADQELSRAELADRTGLNKQVVIRWLRILREQDLVQIVGAGSLQSRNVKYKRSQASYGLNAFDFNALE